MSPGPAFPSPSVAPGGRVAGIVIAVCATSAIIAIALHPTLAARSATDVVAGVARLALADRLVHGTLILIMGALLYGFTVFSLRRGLQDGSVVAGLLAYGVGVLALIGAGLVDGFLTPDVAARYAGGSPQELANVIYLLTFCALAIQVLTKFGFVALSLGILAWSAGLLRTPGPLRTTGLIGAAAAILTLAFLAFGPSHLNPHTLGLIVILEGAWNVAVARLLVRGSI